MNVRATFYAPASTTKPPAFNELDAVVTRRAVETDEGQTVPAGSLGTVMTVLGGGAAYYVDFAEPRFALALVYADNLDAA